MTGGFNEGVIPQNVNSSNKSIERNYPSNTKLDRNFVLFQQQADTRDDSYGGKRQQKAFRISQNAIPGHLVAKQHSDGGSHINS